MAKKKAVPKKKAAPRRSGLTQEDAKNKFIQQLKLYGTVTRAAAAAGISVPTAYNWRKNDPEFDWRWKYALESAADGLEEALYERGLTSDTTAAIFLLKGMRPEKYRERHAISVEEKQIDEAIERELAELTNKED